MRRIGKVLNDVDNIFKREITHKSSIKSFQKMFFKLKFGVAIRKGAQTSMGVSF